MSAINERAVVSQDKQRLCLERHGRTLKLGIEQRIGVCVVETASINLTLPEARVLLVELERAIEAAMAPRSEWVTE